MKYRILDQTVFQEDTFSTVFNSQHMIHMALRKKHTLPINKNKHLFEHGEQESIPFNLPYIDFFFIHLHIIRILSCMLSPTIESKHLAHLLNKFVQDVRIHDPQQDQKRGADGSTYDAADGAETAEAV